MSDWLSDTWNSVKGLFTDDKGDLSSWVKPAVGAGIGLFNQSSQDNARNQYLDFLKRKELENWQAGKSAYEAQLAAAGMSGGGGSSRGGSGASAAAARQTEANRQAAAKKAAKQEQKTYAEALKLYAPFVETTQTLLPQMSKTYQDSLALQGLMNRYVQSPAQQAKLDASIPAYNVMVPIKDRGY